MADLVDRDLALWSIYRLGGGEKMVRLSAAEGPALNPYDDAIYSAAEAIKNLPSAEPDIIYCKDCKRHNISVEDTWDQYKKWCPLVAYRGKAQGHEYDYQFCAFGERRTDG